MMKNLLFSTRFKQFVAAVFLLIAGLANAQAPTITSFSPTSGAVGTAVTITGTGFNTTASNNVVYIGGLKANVTAASATSLTITVPNSAPVGLIAVINTSTKLVGTSALHFKPLNSAISSKNISSRSFASKINLATVAGNGTWYERGNILALADFNNDGKIDIAKGASNSNIGIIKNNCATPGSIVSSDFSSSINVPVGDAVTQIDAGDINGDGKIDLLAAGKDNGFTVVLNNSTGSTISFGTSTAGANDNDYYYFGYQYNSGRAKLADINGDGKLDVICSGWYADKFAVFLNTSTASTLSFSTTPLEFTNSINGSRQMTVGDVNSDGKTDVIMGNEGTGGFLLFINTTSSGTVNFQSPISLTGNGYGQAMVVDLNNDGKNDILGDGKGVFINQDANGTYIASDFTSVANIINNSDTFTGVSDFNGNGKLDVIGYDGYSYANISDNRSTSTTLATANFTTVGFEVSAYADAFSAADFDGDNKQDYISSASSNSFVNVVRNKVGEPINFYPQYSSSLEYYGVWFSDPGVWSYSGGYDQNVYNTADYILNFDLAGSTSYTIYGDLSISSQIKLYSAPFDIGYYNLTTSGVITGLSSSAYIKTSGTGLYKQTVTTSPILFGIGNTSYNPLTITNSSGSSDTFGVRVESEARQSYANYWETTLGYNSIQRLWSVTKTNANGGSGVTIVFNWNASDAKNGTVTTPALFYYNSGTWTKITTGVTISGNSLTLTGYTGTLSDTKFAIADSNYGFAPPPTITSFTPSSAVAGSTITITGTGFTGATAVTVGGTAVTSFTVVNATTITAVVGNGTNGTIQVTTPGGTATSSSSFSFTPSIVKNASLTNFTTCAGTASTAQTFTVSGFNLSANISIAAVTGYEYSLNGTTYSSTLSITPTSGIVASTTVYVRLTSSSTGSPSGTISISSTSATTQTISITGTVNAITTISSQPPASVNVCQGASYTLAGSATGSGSLAYQWYSNTTNSNTGGTSLGSANFAQTGGLSIVTTTPGTYYYYLVVTGSCGTATSNVSTITISPTSVAGTATPSSVTLCSGNTQTLTLSGSTGSIQWQQSADGTTGWANVTGGTGATTASYTTPALTTTTYYRAVVTSGGCTAVNSNVVTVTVPTPPYPYDRAVNFTSGGYLTRATTSSLGLTNFTVEAWIYPTTFNNWAGIVSKQDFQLMTTNTGKLAIMIESGWSWEWTATATNVLNLNQWQHVAASYNASTKQAKLYVNGVLVLTWTRTQNFTPNFTTSALVVGYNNGTGNIPSSPYERNFIGNIDEVKVWNAVRTDAEISNNYAVQLAGTETGLVAYYKFDQGIGSANNTAITSLTDLTANANHLTPSTMTMNGTTDNILQIGPAILSSPTMCLNSTATITHTHTGGTWTTSDANVISIDPNTGTATANAVGTATITYTFSVSGCTYTSTKLFTVPGLPTITVQPSSSAQNICLNGTATALSVTATGAGLTYQWYKNTTAGNTGGTLIVGATSATYTPLATTSGNAYYYCVVSGTCSPVATSSISGLIKVDASSVAGTISSSVASICDSGTATLTLAGSTGSIQWQRFDSPIWSDLNGETNATYTTQTLTQNRIYRAVVTNGACSSATTTGFTVQVNASPAAPTTTATVNYCVGATATALSATATTGYALQWYTVASGGTASTTAPTPVTTTAGQTLYYVSQLQNSSTITTSTSAGTTASYVSGVNFGQTFQVATTSKVNSISIGQIFAYSPIMTMKIYAGFGGTLLGTADATMTGSGYFNPVFTFANSNIILTANQTYYFEVTSSNSVSFYLMSVKNNYTSTGVLYQNNVSNSALDFDFTVISSSIANPCESPRSAITVNVNALPTISGTQPLTVGGSNLQLTGSGNPSSSNPWVSSSPLVATISSTGVVTPVSLGSTNITYTNDLGCSTTVSIAVRDCAAPFSNALSFGVGTTAANADYVQINSRIFPSQSVTNFTIETWVKPATSDIIAGTPGNTWLSFLGYSGTKRSPSMYITNNGVLHVSWTEGYSFVGSAVSASSPTTFTANKWTHVALVKEGTTMRVYVDGIQLTTVTCLANLDLPDNAYWLGKSDQQFSGSLDEVRFWSTARTQSQIQSTMNTELAGNETGLLAYFDFNQGVAGGTNTGITTVTNKANSALNGTLTNFTRTGTTSNFVGSTITNLDIVGAATICANVTSQYTHPIVGGTWSVSNGANASVSTSGLVTSATNENITLSYAYTLNGCSFTATKVISVNTPAAPVANTPVNLCQGATPSALVATATTGNTLQWYTVATAGTASTTAPTPSTSTSASTSYYVSQKSNVAGCEGPRTAITVVVNALTAITTQPVSPSAVCLNASSNTISVTATGQNLTYQWYTNSTNSTTGATAITGATADSYAIPTSVAGTKYYYVIVSGTCGSSVTSSIVSQAITTSTFSTDVSSASQNIAYGGIATALTVVSPGATAYQWYSSPTKPTLLDGFSGTTGFVSSTGAFQTLSGSAGQHPAVNSGVLTFAYIDGSSVYKDFNLDPTATNITFSTEYAETDRDNNRAGDTGKIQLQFFNASNVQVGTTVESAQVTGTLTFQTVSLTNVSIPSGATKGRIIFYQVNETENWAGNYGIAFRNPSVTTDVALNGNAITGATSATYTPSTTTPGALYYYAVATGGCSTATSSLSGLITVSKATPTIGAMTAITKTVEDSAFTLTAPTSNATGAFTFTSSNTAVATISGNTVTIVGTGTATITATQATDANYLSGFTSTTLTVAVGTTQSPVLTHPASNLTGATTFRINYTLPETPRAGSVRLTFVPTSGGSPVIWTMSNATTVDFNYTVTAQPNATYVTTGAALSYGTYNVTLSYQDVYSSPAATATATNIQTLSPPSIAFAQSSYTGFIGSPINAITPTNTGGASSSYSINPSLPNGLTFNTTTGVISGTPTVAQPQTNYTITATNVAGSDSKTIALLIDLDSDGDGVPNSVEVQQGTNPNVPGALDTDNDGVPDYVEVQQGTNPNVPGALDTDNDGVPDYVEVQQVTNPNVPGARDTDGDGVPDYVETQQGTNPNVPGARDTDGDGVPDYVETQQGTNPNVPGARDTDGDGVPDYVETQQGTNPATPGDVTDTDHDGVPDYVELQQGTNPNVPGARDTDGDGVPDYVEVQQGTNPATPGDSIIDTDGDGVPDYVEVQQGTNPNTPGARDTDGDGVPDYVEVQQGTNPATPGDATDTDGDGVPDYVEVQQGTNPATPGDAIDTDGDGLSDYYESENTAPLNNTMSANAIAENNAVGAVIGNFATTDLGDVYPHVYSLVSGSGSTDNTSFTIVGTQLKAAVAFDYETKNSYSIRVKTTDAGGLSYEKVFTITIADVVENVAPTNIVLSATSIAENNDVNAVVGQLSSTDADSGDTHTYTLVSGVGATDNSSFSIVGNQIKAGIAFDFEVKSSYSVRVKTTDAGGLSYEKVFTITVTNVNETPVLTVSQNTIVGVVNVPLTTISVTNSGGAATSFAITPALSAGLTLNTATGAISGTPTAAMASRTYTISGTNPDGTGTVSFTLFIDQDTDRDGLLDSVDTDDDGDGVLDVNDAFPINRLEWTDSDHDGIGNNADTDDDNDGILDGCDVDTNGDGIPDNGTDMDGDGIIDSCDADRDGDGVNNTSDNCPNSPNTNQADRDHDGQGDVCDTIELNTAQAFTPNGDGINDTWVIYNLSNHPGSIVRVFNTTGAQVFYSANYQNNWMGTYQGSGEMLPTGSYLYQIDLGGDGSIDEQGWIYITK